MNELLDAAPLQNQVVSTITYPVKSLPGVLQPDGVEITWNGLAGDRNFTLAGTTKGKEGVAPRLTLREHPELAQIATGYASEGVMLTAEGVDTLILPYNVPEGDNVSVKSWGGPVTGRHVSGEANAWLGDFLKRKDVQILAVPDSPRRVLADHEKNERATAFAGRATDGYPMHAVFMPSLRRLNKRREELELEPIDIGHFRPNLVLDGQDLPPFAEDSLPGMRLEDDLTSIDIVAIRPCERCVTVEADPATGKKLGNVLKTLGTLQPERATTAKLVFGIWAAPDKLSVGGIIRVGQLLKPLPATSLTEQTRSHNY